MSPAARATAPVCAPGQSGAGLLELLISLALLATALLGTAAAVLQSQRAARQALLHMQATELLAELAEQQLSMPHAAAAVHRPSWTSRVAQTLPLGRGRIDTVSSPTHAATAVVEWLEASSGAMQRLQMPLPVRAAAP